jgi:hypothetical protein
LVRLYRNATPGRAAEEEQAELAAHGKVEDALFKAARCGNVTACQVWLHNRGPDRWQDRRNLRVGGHPGPEAPPAETERGPRFFWVRLFFRNGLP